MSTQTYKGGKSGWIKSYIEANKNSKISIQTYKAEKSGWIKYYIEDMKLIYIVGCARADEGLELYAVVPKSLWQSSPYHFPGH